MGVPDFVYEPVILPKGNARREVSDGLLISQGRGVILQTKARSPRTPPDLDRQSAWARKQIGKAASQVRGTRRTLASVPELQLTSRRGHSLTLAADSKRAWPGVVLLDMPGCPSGIDATCDDPETIVMTLDDWHTLNDLVRSTSGVIDYVHRAIDAQTLQIELAKEAVRYANLAAADNELVRQEGGYPVLPSMGLSPREEQVIATLDDWIDSDIAVAAGPNGDLDPDATRRAIEVIDAIPVTVRVETARTLLHKVRKADVVGHAVSGVCQIPPSHHRLLFFFDQAANWSSSEHFSAYVFAYTATRHEELDDLYGPGVSLLLARLSTKSGHVFRKFALIDGDAAELQLPSDERWSILERHGMLTSGGIRPTESLQADDPCPCRSGRKYIRCHAA
ncbi:SEC-C metal-binding domain-containing protein [Candidatus Poriferisodalis sp.]|uniref:SEC-C metal-binding domain-containing protein n=1 Tax=Candidatus Poriferisodalis sp. TaxID=3101277 RepID=UPI003D14C520